MSTVFKSPAGEQAVMAFYDSILERFPNETQMIATHHGDTFIITAGELDAPPLILLHGAGTNSSMWVADIPIYAERFRVYAVDLLGEAGKSSPNRPAWDSPAYAEWLLDVFHSLAIEKASLVGISQGAWTAIKFAFAYPDKVEKLALIAPGGILPDKMSFLFKVLPLMMLGSWGIQRMVKLLYADQPIPEGVTEAMTIMTSHFKPRIGTLPLFTDEELSRLTMPAFLIGGTKDTLRDTAKIAERMKSLLPNLSVFLVSGGGHALNETIGNILPFLLDDVQSYSFDCLSTT